MKNKAKGADKVKRPGLFWALTEGGRALIEYGSHFPYKALRKSRRQGDGHPVLILPGFMATDKSTAPLRKFIHTLGYKGYGWGQGRNLAGQHLIDALLDRLDEIYRTHGEKVSTIGWSLGGVYARQIAKAYPHMVRQVITLGSPFKDVTQANNAKWIYDLLNLRSSDKKIDQELLDDLPLPAPLPTTAIYSKEDGVVPWELCMEENETEIHQNIQVRGSHLGLGVNPAVFEIIEDRLLYREDNWKRFEPNENFSDNLLYPNAKSA